MAKICPKCGFTNEQDYIYCRECGTELPATTQQPKPIANIVICPNCNRENPAVASICSNCGVQLESVKASASQTPYVSDIAPIPVVDQGFQWFYLFTYPFYWIGRVFRFCFGNCCCFCCCDDPSGCNTGGCDCSGCDGGSGGNGDCDCCGGSSDCDCGACGDCGGCDGGDCGGCDCGGCDCGGCDISC